MARPLFAQPDDGGAIHERLARLLETPHLAKIVPRLAPETLHALIRHRGLDACGELLTAATAEQLTDVFDLDLWPRVRSGQDEQFDEDRFGEWLEALAETGTSAAARIIAALDADLVIAGLSRYLRVFDPAALGRVDSEDGATERDETALSGCTLDVGGYVVAGRRADAWDAISALLVELDGSYHEFFEAVLQGCRRLSNSAPEIDGLDELLNESDQLLYDVAGDREQRRFKKGYVTAADARAFLQLARRGRPDVSSRINPIVAAFFRDDAAGAAEQNEEPVGPLVEHIGDSADRATIETLRALLGNAGLLPHPRALLGGAASSPSQFTRIRRLLEDIRDIDEAAFSLRNRELAFLANALVAGSSVQSRAFTAEEGFEAAVAICNLGLEQWSEKTVDAFPLGHSLIATFEVGWGALHELSIFVAKCLLAALVDVRCVDPEIEQGLHRLRRDLRSKCQNGTPWQARGALDVVTMLDMPLWASLVGLLDECPVLPAAMRAIVERRRDPVSATSFEFISTTSQVRDVRAFAERLPELLTR